MIRATTPKHVFAFETDPSEFSRILVTYGQDGYIILEKDQDDMTFETITDTDTGETEYLAWYRLSQEETLRFHPEQGLPYCHNKEKHSKVLVQIRALTSSGEAFASEQFPVSVFDVQNPEVLE